MSLEIAKTIYQQIGKRAFFMIGAKNFRGSENALMFNIGRNSKNINFVQIALNSLDLYDVDFMNVQNRKTGLFVLPVYQIKNIYFDQLTEIIEQKTGLRTKL